VILRAELLILLNAFDRSDNIDAIESLVTDGLSAFIVKDGAIVGLDNTAQGNARLAAMTLPTEYA
jgi:hypothetical protein